jgi:hypothetical protein
VWLDCIQKIDIPVIRRSVLCLYQTFFFKTGESVLSDDDMIKDVDADDLARVDEPPRDAQVFFGRFRITGRVVVDEDH